MASHTTTTATEPTLGFDASQRITDITLWLGGASPGSCKSPLQYTLLKPTKPTRPDTLDTRRKPGKHQKTKEQFLMTFAPDHLLVWATFLSERLIT